MTSMTEGAHIIPFRPRPVPETPVPELVSTPYIVHGRFERHRRSFNIRGWSVADAVEAANSLIAFYAHHSSGTYGPLVWQRGHIVLLNVCTGEEVAVLTPSPLPLQAVADPADPL